MAHRTFKDQLNREWQVWEVHPGPRERRKSSSSPPGEGDRREPNAPERAGLRLVVPEQMQEGWLAFQHGNERRRIVPAPAGWEKLHDTELRRLLDTAKPAGTVRRLIE